MIEKKTNLVSIRKFSEIIIQLISILHHMVVIWY